MKIGILGTGEVGDLIGSKLIENGHQVMMGGRQANNQKGLAFANKHSSANASYGTFADASKFGGIIFNATNGRFALEALKLAQTDFADKIIIDVANPLDFTTTPPFTSRLVASFFERVSSVAPSLSRTEVFTTEVVPELLRNTTGTV